jgi:hypothetical protein
LGTGESLFCPDIRTRPGATETLEILFLRSTKMKTLGLFSLFILLCGLSGTAKAFQFSIQDPISVEALEVFANTPFTITFGACQLGEGADGCFYGANGSGATLTSLDAIFPATDALSGSGGPVCDVSNHPLSDFSTTPVCGPISSGTEYELLFTGTPGILAGGFFTIEETGVSPDSFPEGTGVAGGTGRSAPVPEPGSIALLSSGTLMLGTLLRRRRK